MLKPVELRINNYLWYEATIHVVCGIKEESVLSWWVNKGKANIEYNESLDLDPYIDNISQYKPIQLDEQWLIRFGFRKEKWFDNSDDLIIGLPVKAVYLFWEDNRVVMTDRHGYKLMVSIYYVHQLQNIYFSLTGEELSLKTKAVQNN